jgi:hypothetical protein
VLDRKPNTYVHASIINLNGVYVMVTIQQALFKLKRANDISYSKAERVSHADLGNLYLNAANSLLMAMQQANMNADSELAATVLRTYNKAASYFMHNISETADCYGAINKYLSVEVSACAAAFILNGNLDIDAGLVASLMEVDAVLKTSVVPYAAGELLQKYAEKSAGDNGHYGLANALYELAVKHLGTAVQDKDVSTVTIDLYKKTLHQWQKLTEKFLDVAREYNDEPRVTKYELQKHAITKKMAQVPNVFTKKSFLEEPRDKDLENVTPSSTVKRRSRPQ